MPAAPACPPAAKRHDPLAPTPRRPAELDVPPRPVAPAKRSTFNKAAGAPAPPRGPRAPGGVDGDVADRTSRPPPAVTLSPETVADPVPSPASLVSAPSPHASAPSRRPAAARVAARSPSGRLGRAWVAVRDGTAHYYYGTKEMFRQLRVSGQLIRRQLLGYDLTRRERSQLRRTRGDLLRLIPFVPFVVIPFAELLLPFAVKIFPRMLPSTFEPANAEALRAMRAMQARAEAAQTVAKVLEEHALPPAASSPSALAALAAVRAQPETVNTTTVIKAAQAFDEDSVLLALPRTALVAMAQFLSLASRGTFSLASAAETAASLGLSLDGYLRFLIRRRLTALRGDDIMLLYSTKGTAHLDPDELRNAVRERGIDLAVPASLMEGEAKRDEALRLALHDWVLLHVEHRIAPTILVLASAVTAAQGALDPVLEGAAKSNTDLAGYAACLHALLTHTPSGLDTRQSHAF